MICSSAYKQNKSIVICIGAASLIISIVSYRMTIIVLLSAIVKTLKWLLVRHTVRNC